MNSFFLKWPFLIIDCADCTLEIERGTPRHRNIDANWFFKKSKLIEIIFRFQFFYFLDFAQPRPLQYSKVSRLPVPVFPFTEMDQRVLNPDVGEAPGGRVNLSYLMEACLLVGEDGRLLAPTCSLQDAVNDIRRGIQTGEVLNLREKLCFLTSSTTCSRCLPWNFTERPWMSCLSVCIGSSCTLSSIPAMTMCRLAFASSQPSTTALRLAIFKSWCSRHRLQSMSRVRRRWKKEWNCMTTKISTAHHHLGMWGNCWSM